ncbi:MAG TPA: response regulator [Acetobacteraceae bacterium]|nr:response regulator [Acetobacteraceae bacterium]
MPGAASTDLDGLFVLVVEDTVLVADLLTEALAERGCRIVGPAARLEHGLSLAATTALDGALLDVNLAGETCFPIADALAARGVPFAFLTGYGDAVLPPTYRTAPRLTKPFDLEQMIELAARHFRRK